MEAVILVLRTLLIYFVINIMLRLMGKREIGKLSIFDLVISIMIAEMAVIVIDDANRALWEGILPMAILVITQILIAQITLKSRYLRELFEGRPSVLIQNGKLKWKEMRQQRYSLDDLLMQLRESNVHNVADVEFAILETTGKLSVVTKNAFHKDEPISNKKTTNGEKQASAPESTSTQIRDPEGNLVTVRYEGLPLPLIMDGKVHEDNLKKIDKNRFWLLKELRSRGVKDLKNVFLCTVDHKGQLFIDQKER